MAKTTIDHKDRSGTETLFFQVEGMTCGACSSRVEKVLSKIPGVETAEVNLTLERATVTCRPSIKQNLILKAVNEAGFTITLIKDDKKLSKFTSDFDIQNRISLIIAITFTIPFILQVFFRSIQDWTGIIFQLPIPLAVLLASVIQFGIGLRFYRGAYHSLKFGSANMDVLVAMGTTTAYLYSMYNVLAFDNPSDQTLYFEASVIIITLVIIGKSIELRAKRSANSAIHELCKIQPETANVRQKDGTEEIRPIQFLNPGDVVLCRQGDRIPVDGIVISGEAEIDESLITGESIPIVKLPGAEIITGSINLNGFIEINVKAVGDESTLGRVIRLVETAQTKKPNIQRLVDQVSHIFVPVIISLALFTFLFWYLVSGNLDIAILNAVSVLVIACPCALGLATPTAIVAGAGAAARAGILVKDIEVLERSRDVTHVIFDKTGTLTEGKPRIVNIFAFVENYNDELLTIAASLQHGSGHPVAKAFKQLAEEKLLSLPITTNFNNHVARGVEGTIGGNTYFLGNLNLFQENFHKTPPKTDTYTIDSTAVWLAKIDNSECEFLAQFDLVDTLRPNIPILIEKLNQLGTEVLLVSGDSESAVSYIGNQIGIHHTFSCTNPQQKESIVGKLIDDGANICMVGDGINDAPALARANIGIAMGSGTEVAMETAEITLMRADPTLVVETISLSRLTIRKIKQNLFWAFSYNIIGVPLAAMGFLFPALAAIMMTFSSISVLINSLTLRSWKPQDPEIS